jgi:hypothetical protein
MYIVYIVYITYLPILLVAKDAKFQRYFTFWIQTPFGNITNDVTIIDTNLIMTS